VVLAQGVGACTGWRCAGPAMCAVCARTNLGVEHVPADLVHVFCPPLAAEALFAREVGAVLLLAMATFAARLPHGAGCRNLPASTRSGPHGERAAPPVLTWPSRQPLMARYSRRVARVHGECGASRVGRRGRNQCGRWCGRPFCVEIARGGVTVISKV